MTLTPALAFGLFLHGTSPPRDHADSRLTREPLRSTVDVACQENITGKVAIAGWGEFGVLDVGTIRIAVRGYQNLHAREIDGFSLASLQQSEFFRIRYPEFTAHAITGGSISRFGQLAFSVKAGILRLSGHDFHALGTPKLIVVSKHGVIERVEELDGNLAPPGVEAYRLPETPDLQRASPRIAPGQTRSLGRWEIVEVGRENSGVVDLDPWSR